MSTTMMLFIGIVIFPSVFGVAIYFAFEPYKTRRYDVSVKPLSNIKFVGITALGFLFIIMLSWFLAQLWIGNAAFVQFIETLDKSKEAQHAISSVPDQLSEHLLNYASLVLFGVMLVSGIVAFYTAFIVHFVIRYILAFSSRTEHYEVQKLLGELRNQNVQATVRSYYEMKNSGSKDKLYISQWEEVVRYLLLVGDIEEAEYLNHYLHERSNYIPYLRGKMFESKYKVALFDIDQMEIDRRIAKKRVQKLPKDVQKKLNIFE
ncbi:hypothetical protein [Staphylococcus caprae]|uniref:hypothetical protein n=1 Tax=Staphylococcus caprae TaxID=29380 RepID=UPI0014523EBF|nr:hypothetical protein [Staphylococcus caprae]QJE26663.1 hypothetical protein HHJ99_12905 [Staphylococcus caprae]